LRFDEIAIQSNLPERRMLMKADSQVNSAHVDIPGTQPNE
jgi:hypothetical protein